MKKSEVSQLCLTLCDLMACSLPGSSVHGIFQARALEWVAISFSNPEKTMIQKDTYTPVFIATLFTIARTWKQPQCPSTEEWVKKLWHIYTVEYYSAIKKNKIMPFAATWMDWEIVILSEVSQTQKDKYHMKSLICGILKKQGYQWTHLQNRSIVMDVENKLMVTRG